MFAPIKSDLSLQGTADSSIYEIKFNREEMVIKYLGFSIFICYANSPAINRVAYFVMGARKEFICRPCSSLPPPLCLLRRRSSMAESIEKNQYDLATTIFNSIRLE